MLLDALTAAALAGELRERLTGARVQAVLQPDRLSVVLELYAGARHYLTLSADPAHEGLALSDQRTRRGEGAATPLTLALRAHLVGARLRTLDQPQHERLIDFTFDAGAPVRLIAELTGRLANLVFLDASGTVIAAAHPVTAAMTRVRVVLPGRAYMPPPAPAKAAPEGVTADEVAAWLAASPDAPAWRALVNGARGVSPLAAREIVHRATGDAEARAHAAPATAVHAALAALLASAAAGDWSPCVVWAGGEVVAYAPYTLSHRCVPGAGDTVCPAASTIEALSAFLADRIGRDPYRTARSTVAGAVEVARERLARRAAALAREQADGDQIDALRQSGDLILTWQRRIARGQALFTPPPEAGTDRPIELDPALSAVDNAQAYYQRYRRKRRAAAEGPVRLAEVAAALATVEQLATDLALAEDRAGIDAVRDALVDGGYLGAPPATRRHPGASRPLEVVSSDGFTVLVGRNSRQNEQVTFQRAARGDVWLHARGVPGGHVLVKAAGRPVPERTLVEAAALAAWYSRARDDARASVATTDVRHVRRMKGGGPGMVTYDHDETLIVAPRSPEALWPT